MFLLVPQPVSAASVYIGKRVSCIYAGRARVTRRPLATPFIGNDVQPFSVIRASAGLPVTFHLSPLGEERQDPDALPHRGNHLHRIRPKPAQPPFFRRPGLPGSHGSSHAGHAYQHFLALTATLSSNIHPSLLLNFSRRRPPKGVCRVFAFVFVFAFYSLFPTLYFPALLVPSFPSSLVPCLSPSAIMNFLFPEAETRTAL